jgi:hypothetical protein
MRQAARKQAHLRTMKTVSSSNVKFNMHMKEHREHILKHSRQRAEEIHQVQGKDK